MDPPRSASRFRSGKRATRGLVAKAVKAIVIKVAKVAADKTVSFVLPKLAELVEREIWKKRGLKEGWLKLSKETLAAGALVPGKPVSPARSLLFIHGTFSNAVSCYRDLAASNFFDRVKDAYGDRIFAFDHFSVSRTPEQNARMLLETLPEQTTTFDVVTHSRGGLVLRNLVERSKQLGELSRRFKLGRAVLVASPNDGTPLATPARWDETVGWLANLLELFPENPFTTGAAFVANGLVWLANHASGDLPGLHSMDAHGDLIAAIQSPPGPPADAYSALVANYHPTEKVLQRLVDVGHRSVLRVGQRPRRAVRRRLARRSLEHQLHSRGRGSDVSDRAATCPVDSVTHVSFFSHAQTVDFLVNALLGRQQPLNGVDPRKGLPVHRLMRGGDQRRGREPVPRQPVARRRGRTRPARRCPPPTRSRCASPSSTETSRSSRIRCCSATITRRG